MARDLNKSLLIGRLGADPEMRFTPGGSPVTNFRLAVNRRSRAGDGGEVREETDWFGIVAWNRLAEICAEHLHKGSKVYVEGRLQTRSYDGQDGVKRYVTEIVASDLIMLDTRTGVRAGGGELEEITMDDGDIPF